MQLIGLPNQLCCPQCASPMIHLSLAGRSGTVQVDHCAPCRLVWFDPLESVQLLGLGWVTLLRELQPGTADPYAEQPHHTATALNCPVCRADLKQVHNRTRFGRFRALECPRCQGHLHSHSGLLAERGLVRPLLRTERLALAQERRSLCCLNCGAPSDGSSEDCRYCASPLVMLDLPRLTHALLLRPGRTHELAPAPAGRLLAWACRGCGAALDPSRQTACPQCSHAVVAPSLLDITPLLDQVEAELRAETAGQARPPPRPGRRPRDWRETGLARLLHRLGPDKEEMSSLGLQLASGALLLLLGWWLSS